MEIDNRRQARTDADRGWKWYYEELMSNGCACGRTKKDGRSFCYRWDSELPWDMKRALYRRLADGYEEAFDEAAAWLEREVW